jgi:hypothetical protein
MNLDAGVITAAAASVLGILALLIIVIGIIALRLFEHAPVTVKLIIFIMMLGSASALGATIIEMPGIQCQPKADTAQETASIAASLGNPSPSPGAHHV